MSVLYWDGRQHRPLAGEGGHQDLPARDADEWALREFAAARLGGRVSIERVVAGPGFALVYDFLVATGRGTIEPRMRERFAAGDRNAAVSEAGVAGEDPTAERAVDMVVSLYGAAAGNLALVARATGGVFVAGGIAPKILPKLRSGAFLESLRDKGRLRPFIEKIPVKVVLEPRTALLGAAAFAARDRHRLGGR
jgi:glucokinase